jgi:SAM-dependent methyltransferase
MSMASQTCRLCNSNDSVPVDAGTDKRGYYKCNCCHLIFVDSKYLPSAEKEKTRYLSHQNSPGNEGYLNFLKIIIEPSLSYINPQMVGLDYGCGPEPVLSQMLKEKDITCFNYDPYFHQEHPFTSYDFIFATECFEHFFFPKNDIALISDLLKPEGYLCIMTERYDNLDMFKTWYYKRDITHVSFYHMLTIDYICLAFGFDIVYKDQSRGVILRKTSK